MAASFEGSARAGTMTKRASGCSPNTIPVKSVRRLLPSAGKAPPLVLTDWAGALSMPGAPAPVRKHTCIQTQGLNASSPPVCSGKCEDD